MRFDLPLSIYKVKSHTGIYFSEMPQWFCSRLYQKIVEVIVRKKEHQNKNKISNTLFKGGFLWSVLSCYFPWNDLYRVFLILHLQEIFHSTNPERRGTSVLDVIFKWKPYHCFHYLVNNMSIEEVYWFYCQEWWLQ